MIEKVGVGYDWRFDPKLFGDWNHVGTEYIKELRCLAVRPDFVLMDNAVTPDATFRNVYVPAQTVKAWVEFVDGAVHAAGTESANTWTATVSGSQDQPNIMFNLVRATPPPAQGVAAFTSIRWAATRGLTGLAAWSSASYYSYGDQVSHAGDNWQCVAPYDNHTEPGTNTLVWVEALGDSGFITLVLPVKTNLTDWQAYSKPFLHFMFPDPAAPYSWFDDGEIVSVGPQESSMGKGEERFCFLVEFVQSVARYDDGTNPDYLVPGVRQGMHILIRQAQDLDKFWHYHAEGTHLVSTVSGADMVVSCCGCSQQFNVSTLSYPDGSYAIAPEYWTVPLSAPETFDDSIVYGHVDNYSTGWSETVTDVATVGTNQHLPVIQFNQDAVTYPECPYVKPLVWYAFHESPGTMTAAADPNDYVSTDTYGDLKGMEVEWDWTLRNKRARLMFHPGATAPYTNVDGSGNPYLRANSRVALYGGWDANAVASVRKQTLGMFYVPPGGIKRYRDGDQNQGDPCLDLDLESFDQVRLPRKATMDWRQAGGRTVENWTDALAMRLGIAAANVYVAAAVQDIIIPLNLWLPSQPNLHVVDGSTWDQHIRAVCDAVGALRVGFDVQFGGSNYGLYVDAGPPAYNHGVSTISYTLNLTAFASDEGLVMRVEHGNEGGEFRNCLKATIGDDYKRRQSFYWIETEATRLAGIGDVWNLADADKEGETPVDVYAAFLRDHYQSADFIRFENEGLPAIRPDHFIQIGSATGIGLATASPVYQVKHHKWRGIADEVSECVSEITMAWVHDGT